MKKYLVAITMLMTLAMGQTVVAQSQQKKDAQELVDSTSKDALEAYSDKTLAKRYFDDKGYKNAEINIRQREDVANKNHVILDSFPDNFLNNIGIEGLMGMGFVLMVVLIVFVLAPVLILAVLLFFVYKNRKQKMKLAEMAMKQGQPIPDQLLVEEKDNEGDLWQKGLRQTFLGVGLLAFFGYVGSTLGIGIGILVTVIGLGKLAIVKTSKH